MNQTYFIVSQLCCILYLSEHTVNNLSSVHDVHVAKHLECFFHRNANVLTIDETSGVLNQTINGVYELKTVGVDYT